MRKWVALLNPYYVAERVKYHGFGRVIIKSLVFHRALQRPIRRLIKFCKILVGPVEYVSRRIAARRIVRSTAFQLIIPRVTGFRVFAPGEIPGSQEVVAICHRLYEERVGEILAASTDRKSFNLLSPKPRAHSQPEATDLSDVPELLRFAMSPQLLRPVTEYLGELPELGTVMLVYTAQNDNLAGSQLYHIDMDDFREVKFFMAIHDIGEDNGPLTFLPADATDQVRTKLGYNGGRLADANVYRVVPRERAIKLIGPAGSSVLVDVCRCLHYGERAQQGPRLLLTIHYVSRFNAAESALDRGFVHFDKTLVANNPVGQMLLRVQ